MSADDPAMHARGMEAGEDSVQAIAGDRGIPSVNRTRSLQARVSNALAIALMGGLGIGMLGWYYAHAFARRSQARQSERTAVRSKAQGEMVLPALGRVDPPVVASQDSAMAQLLGPAPPLPDEPAASMMPAVMPGVPAGAQMQAPVRDPQIERLLKGPAYVSASLTSAAPGPDGGAAAPAGATPTAHAATGLEGWLTPTLTPASLASVLPTQRLLLPKGAFIDCTLETALDSTLPGMATCVTATDTFSADGKVVLIERGTKLVGETRGTVQRGSARIFVLWSEARTPTGVVVPLASPGTDELGRSGLPGEVDRHFFERFGAAILISMIDGVVQGAVQSARDGATVIYNPSTSQDILTEVLRSTVDIPPTVRKAQGDRIQVLVARDLDFRAVYRLRSVAQELSGGERAE